MKNRKIFLDGYIKLVPELLRGRVGKNGSYVSVQALHGHIFVNAGAINDAKVLKEKGEVVSADIGIHENKDKFVIVFDDEGVFKTKKYNTGGIRFSNQSTVKKLIESGFRSGARYKVTSPEENVLVVTKEEA